VQDYGPDQQDSLSDERLGQVEMAAFLSVMRAATRSISDGEKVLRDNESGLSLKEWDVLVFVFVAGSARPSQLLRRTALTRSPQTLSSLIDRLETKGLVARARHTTDGRGVLVSITDRGRRTVDTLFPLIARRAVAPFSAHFTDAEMTTITSLLGRL